MANGQTIVRYEKGRLYILPIGIINPNPSQPRKYFDEEGLAGLTQSVKDKGVIQPTLVRQTESGAPESFRNANPRPLIMKTILSIFGKRSRGAGLAEKMFSVEVIAKLPILSFPRRFPDKTLRGHVWAGIPFVNA